MKNIKILANSRQEIIDFLNNNRKIRFEVIYEAKQDETKRIGLTILTWKRML